MKKSCLISTMVLPVSLSTANVTVMPSSTDNRNERCALHLPGRQIFVIIVLTGAGDTAFCAGGDMNVKGHGGYIGKDGVARLNVLDVQKQIRSMPKPVIAAVNGFIGGVTFACRLRPYHRF